jgi:hypothetical protein
MVSRVSTITVHQTKDFNTINLFLTSDNEVQKVYSDVTYSLCAHLLNHQLFFNFGIAANLYSECTQENENNYLEFNQLEN